jgi:hypothetical protein
MNTELAVALFNRRFKGMLEVSAESGTVFDYNVYSMDWIHNLKFQAGRAKGAGGLEKDVVEKITPGTEHSLVRKDDEQDREAHLEKASLLHIRRYATADEWKAYTQDRVDRAGNSGAAVRALMLEVNAQHVQFEAAIRLRGQAIQQRMDEAAQQHESAWGQHDAHYKGGAVRTSASNRIYEERLRLVKQLRARHAELVKDGAKTGAQQRLQISLAKETSKALSEALYFANEVYASEGGTIHAVIGMQTAGKQNDAQADTGVKVSVALTGSQWLQAFNENVGDVLKDFSHFADDPPFAVYRAGKYMDRMCRTAVEVRPKVADMALYKFLSDVAAKSVAVKNSPAGDDPIKSREAFADWKAERLETLRARVIAFGGYVAAARPPSVARDPADEPDEESRPEPAQIGKARDATRDVASMVATLPGAVS